MKILSICIFVLAALIMSGKALAEPTVVIVHKDNAVSEISDKDLKGLFLGKKKSINGTKFVPIELSNNSATKKDFHKKVTSKSLQQLNAYWSRLIFTGKAVPPNALGSGREVVEYVSVSPLAIGYVDSSEVDESVKVIKVIP